VPLLEIIDVKISKVLPDGPAKERQSAGTSFVPITPHEMSWSVDVILVDLN
jgi:hypothetical protein